MDYYKLLNLNRTDNPSDKSITKSYRKAAMKWHPDKWANKSKLEQENAEKKFKEINNAYSILSNPEKKKMYDLYGENGLKKNNQIPSNFSRNGVKIFFGNNNGDPFSHFFFNQQPQFRKKKSVRVKTHIFKCSLEELYLGCVKKIKISEGDSSKTIAIKIVPGTKNNTEIMYNWTYNNTLHKIKFVIKELKHHIFVRENENLIYTCNIKSTQVGNKIKITLYDLMDKEIPIIIQSNEIYQNYQKVLIGKGMPIIGKGSFGDMIISFNII